MNALKFSPTPWRRSTGLRGTGNVECEGIDDANGDIVANCGTHGGLQADTIITAVNAHSALLQALWQAQAKIAGDNRALASDVLLENIARALAKAGV